MKWMARIMGLAAMALVAGCGDGGLSVLVLDYYDHTHKADAPAGMAVVEFSSEFSETGGVVVVRFEPKEVVP